MYDQFRKSVSRMPDAIELSPVPIPGQLRLPLESAGYRESWHNDTEWWKERYMQSYEAAGIIPVRSH